MQPRTGGDDVGMGQGNERQRRWGPGSEPVQGMREQRGDLYRLLVQHVKDYAIFLLDPQGHIMTWNEGAERIKGYRSDEILGQHFSRFYPPEAVGRGTPAIALRTAAKEGRWEEENWRVRKDGTRFWADVVITALYDERGTLVGFAKVTRDLSERKQAEEERLRLVAREQQARAQAEAAQAVVQAQDEFLAVAAHELKTPMSGAKLAAQMLLRRLSKQQAVEPDQLVRALQTIDWQINRLAGLVTQLLETTRLNADRLILNHARTDVAALVRAAVEQVQQGTELHTVALIADADPAGALWADVDAGRVEQVVANLLDNALKFSPDGGRIEVQLSQATPDLLRLTVRDQGIGVPEEHRPRLFERFYQAHADTHQSGLGLGLYISREIVVRHGGEISAEYPPEGGTCMVVTLPVHAATAQPDKALTASDAAITTKAASDAAITTKAASDAAITTESTATADDPETDAKQTA